MQNIIKNHTSFGHAVNAQGLGTTWAADGAAQAALELATMVGHGFHAPGYGPAGVATGNADFGSYGIVVYYPASAQAWSPWLLQLQCDSHGLTGYTVFDVAISGLPAPTLEQLVGSGLWPQLAPA